MDEFQPRIEVVAPTVDVGALARVALQWLTVGVLAVVGVVPLIGNQLRVQNWDPQFMRDIIERVHRFGGTFYDNGIYNKGPLEPMTYDLARHLGGYDGMWFFISVFSALAALLCALAAGRTARWRGAPVAVGLASGVVLYMHLTLSPSDYAGVLYARNLTMALMAASWLLTFEHWFWRSPRSRMLSCAAVGLLLGFVVQALLSEVFAAAAVGLALLAMLRHHGVEAPERRKLARLAVGGSVVGFFGAPVWYLLRGSFASYWASWYEHARVTATGTQRGLASQFALGWRQMYSYYQHRPLALLAIAAFSLFTYVTWTDSRGRDRIMNLALLGWLAGSWLEQILNQRYSSHYFVINTVPTALMIAVLVGRGAGVAARHPRFARTAVALPLTALLGTLYLSGTKDFQDAVKRTSSFTSFAATAREADSNKSGPVKSDRAVLDLVSRDNDAILAWTNTPWPYLDLHRVAAGRFIWKSFLMGEVYLGATGPQYVVPHTWDWFRDDIRRSKPAAYVKTEDDPAPGTPFAALVRDQFRVAYAGAQPVYLRDDVAREVLAGDAEGQPLVPVPGVSPASGWSVGTGSATYRGGTGQQSVSALPLTRTSCVRIDGLVDAGDALPAFDVRFDDTDAAAGSGGSDQQGAVHLKLQGATAGAGTDSGQYESIPSGVHPGDHPVDFSVVIGRRAAALVVGGQIRAATRIPRSVMVSLVPGSSSLSFTELRVGPAPSVSGC